tara:strand:+ start:106 stop:507 length:402 start_codon:yes stop_codon:yes gene_type:complete
MNLKKHILIYIGLILFSSCGVQIKLELLKDLENSGSKIQIIVENTNSTTYKGWWIYGDEQHIFKDEQTLDEYLLEFPNEDIDELKALYIAVCEMEYFPMESTMTGCLKKNILDNKSTLVVSNFEILHIQGCGE